MMLENDQQLANTQRQLALLTEQIARAESREDSPGNRESVRALVSMADQLREEIVRYESRQKRRAS
jgi:hypothetical protein